MSEYRRFISYIYRYKNGKKRDNCGFVKVEIRSGICRMGVHLEPKERIADEVQVYGFVRIQGKLLGISAGNAGRRGNAWEWQASMPADHFASSEYGISDINGIWLRTGKDDHFVTVWDDEPVDPELFVTSLPEEKEKEELPEEHLQMQEMYIEEKKTLHSQGSPAETPGSLFGRWENFLNHYPQIEPFEDEEIFQCVCIAPKDLSFLPRAERQFAASPFLREGYERYGHLLLGCHCQGRYVLAVPGMSGEMQDKHLARMCGFPYFKEARKDRQAAFQEGKENFGYWYHFLNEECPQVNNPAK